MKKKIAFIIAGVLVIAAAGFFLWPKADPLQDIAKKYDLVKVQKMNLSETVEVTGTVYPLEKKDIYSDFTGIVKAVKVKAGEQVQKGDVLLTIDSSSLKEQWDEAETLLKQAKLNLAKAKVQLGTEFALNQISADNALQLENYTHELSLYQEQVKQAEQRLAALEEKNDGRLLDDVLTIRAPFSGQVAWINVKSGDKVLTEELLATVINADALGVEADVDQNDIGLIRTGQTVKVVGKDTKQTENIAVVTEISTQGQADGEVINFPVRMKITGTPQGLQSGMSVDVTIIAAEYPDVLTVPAAGVIEKDGRSEVNVLRGKSIVPVTVKLGYQQGKYWEVLSGLKSGDKVAIVKPALLSKGSNAGQSHGMGPFGRKR